jgi:hypothetical protein
MFDPNSVSPAFIRHHAEQFDVSRFKQQMMEFIEEKIGEQSSVIGSQ